MYYIYGIYISQLVRFARCWTRVLDFHSKNLQITLNMWSLGYRYQKLWKTFRKFFRSYSELPPKFCYISFEEYVSIWFSNPVLYGYLVFKLRRAKGTTNFISVDTNNLQRRLFQGFLVRSKCAPLFFFLHIEFSLVDARLYSWRPTIRMTESWRIK